MRNRSLDLTLRDTHMDMDMDMDMARSTNRARPFSLPHLQSVHPRRNALAVLTSAVLSGWVRGRRPAARGLWSRPTLKFSVWARDGLCWPLRVHTKVV